MAVRPVRFDIVGAYRGKPAFAALHRDLRSSKLALRGLMSGAGVLGAGQLGGGLAFGGLVAAARNAVREFDDILDRSKASGVSTDLFQALSAGAVEAGADVGTLNSALLTFAQNSGLAAAGKGRMVAQLKALNPELLKAIQNTTSQDERLRLLADAIAEEDDASRRSAIGKATLGEAWAELLPVFENGARGIDELVAKARDLGIIVPPDLLARASELEGKLNTLSQVIRVQLNSALVELGPLLYGGAQALAEFARQANTGLADDDILQFLGEFNARLEAGDSVATAAAAAWSKIANEADKLAQRQQWAAEKTAELIEQLEGAKAEVADLQSQGTSVADDLGFIDAAKAKVDELTAKLHTMNAAAYAAFETQRGLAFSGLPVASTLPGAALPPASPGSGSGSASGPDPKEVIADLKFEEEQLNRTAEAQRLFNELKRAGVGLDSEYGREIEAIVGRLNEQEVAQRAAADAAREHEQEQRALARAWERVGEEAGDALGRVILDGEKAGELIRELILQFARAQLSNAFGGIFSRIGSGIFGSVLGAGRSGPSFAAPAFAGVAGGGAGRGAQQVHVQISAAPSPALVLGWELKAQEAENRAVARGPAVARDNQRRFGTP